jgi:RHS repeat-associated protein
VLATISDRKFGVSSGGSSLIDHYEPDIVTAQDYYPFGMMSRVALPNSGVPYKFGFNGKLNDNEVKGGLGLQQDYGMRIYDPRVGRFLSVDPLVKTFPWYTPYQSTGNNPVNYIDLDGSEPPPTTSQATPRTTRPVIDPGIIKPDWNNPGGTVPRGINVPGEPIGYSVPTWLGKADLNIYVPPYAQTAQVTQNPHGIYLVGKTTNGTSYIIPIYEAPEKKELTWVDRLVAGVQIERLNQFNIKKQWNGNIQSYEQITTDPSQLNNEYLEKVNRRLLNGTATDQDKLYANEVAQRKEAGLIADPEMTDFIQGKLDKAVRKETDVPEGYKLTKLKSHGQKVYSNGKYWISPDQDGHNGGVWKMYDSEKSVGKGKNYRIGTYDANLNRVGD